MDKIKFRIGELSKKLKVKKFVIRFWEKEFDLESDRSDGGQRFYNQEDLQKFSIIKDLLYNKKFTIPGAKKQLHIILYNQKHHKSINPATKILEEHNDMQINVPEQKPKFIIPQKLLTQIKELKDKLLQFKAKLN